MIFALNILRRRRWNFISLKFEKSLNLIILWILCVLWLAKIETLTLIRCHYRATVLFEKTANITDIFVNKSPYKRFPCKNQLYNLYINCLSIKLKCKCNTLGQCQKKIRYEYFSNNFILSEINSEINKQQTVFKANLLIWMWIKNLRKVLWDVEPNFT